MNPAVLVSRSETAGCGQAAGLSHWLPCCSPSTYWQMLFPSLNVSQMALLQFWSDYKFSKGRNFKIIACPRPLSTNSVTMQLVFVSSELSSTKPFFQQRSLHCLQMFTKYSGESQPKCICRETLELSQEQSWSCGPVGCEEACLHNESSQQSPNPAAMGGREGETECVLLGIMRYGE